MTKPILFNTEMVRAILDGRKTVTRRVVKFLDGRNPTWTGYIPDGAVLYGSNNIPAAKTPYRPGDILYVRETWKVQAAHRFESDVRIMFKAGGPLSTIQFPGGNSQATSRDDYDAFIDKWMQGDGWRPSIYMPKEAARIFLRVTDVRVERLQQITNEQATVEGIRFTDFGMYQPSWKASLDGGKTFHPAKPIHHPGYHAKDVFKPEQCFPTARGAFANLWDSTIKPVDRDRYGWAANPWVWVIGFERCAKPKEAIDGSV